MKHKLSDRSDWQRVIRRRFSVEYLDTAEFTGYVSIFWIDDITEPLVVSFKEQEYCIVDKGFAWLQYFPEHASYAVTAMFDASGKITQWYIDICKQWGLDERGIPWYDDLYLDIIVTPSRETWILDAEELDEALQQGEVSQAEYDIAWQETNRLIAEIEQGSFTLLAMSETHLFNV